MPKLIRILSLLLGVAISAPFASSQAQQSEMPLTTTPPAAAKKINKRPQQRQAYREELGKLLESNAVACEKDSDCDAIGVGTMACGGPKEFLPLSKATLNKVQRSAEELTAAIAEMDEAKNRESNQVGICIALEKPKLSCLSGKCEASK